MYCFRRSFLFALWATQISYPLFSSPPGEALLIVEAREPNSLPSLHMIEPDWFIAPHNVHSQKTLERALFKHCLKTFHAKRRADLDNTVHYEKHFCTKKQECGDRIVAVKLTPSSKLLLEAFHEFSIVWHKSTPDKTWRPATVKETKHYSVADKSKVFLKHSRYKGHMLSYTISKTHEPDLSVNISIFRQNDKKRIFSLMGKQYSPESLERILNTPEELAALKRAGI